MKAWFGMDWTDPCSPRWWVRAYSYAALGLAVPVVLGLGCANALWRRIIRP